MSTNTTIRTQKDLQDQLTNIVMKHEEAYNAALKAIENTDENLKPDIIDVCTPLAVSLKTELEKAMRAYAGTDTAKNALLSTMPFMLERSQKKLQRIIERLEIPRPLDEPDERNEVSKILRGHVRGLDTAIQVIKNIVE